MNRVTITVRRGVEEVDLDIPEDATARDIARALDWGDHYSENIRVLPADRTVPPGEALGFLLEGSVLEFPLPRVDPVPCAASGHPPSMDSWKRMAWDELTENGVS